MAKYKEKEMVPYKLIEMTGKRFNRWTVESMYGSKKNGRGFATYWNCVCDCGKHGIIEGSRLRSGKSKSCGCLRNEMASARRKIDLTGQRFTKLLVIKEAYTKNYSVYWECLCDCGNTCYVPTHRLTTGTTKSCGCILKDIMGPKLYVDIAGKKSGKLTAIEPTEMRSHRQVLWRCSCECGGETLCCTTDFLNGHVMSCGCVKSKGEEAIAGLLTKCNITYKKNYKFKDLYLISKKGRKTRLMFDFAILTTNGSVVCVIEFQGLQHYTPTSRNGFGDQQRLVTDNMKREYCSRNNIPLYEIKYDENIEERINEILCVHVNPVGIVE